MPVRATPPVKATTVYDERFMAALTVRSFDEDGTVKARATVVYAMAETLGDAPGRAVDERYRRVYGVTAFLNCHALLAIVARSRGGILLYGPGGDGESM